MILQVLGFMVLLSGTSVYNELLRAWLPDVFSRSNSLANLEEAEVPSHHHVPPLVVLLAAPCAPLPCNCSATCCRPHALADLPAAAKRGTHNLASPAHQAGSTWAAC